MTPPKELLTQEGVKPLWMGEATPYTFTTTAAASNPVVTGWAVKRNVSGDTWTDVTAGVAPGTPTVSGDTITTPLFTPDQAGFYRLIVTYTSGGRTLEAVGEVMVYAL